jgi:hypothetical protein
MAEAVGAQLNYLSRLRSRMDRKSFPPTDPLYREVQTAWAATQSLYVRLHYMSCESGVREATKP